MDQQNISQNPLLDKEQGVAEMTIETQSTSTRAKPRKKKKLVFGILGAILLIVAVVAFVYVRGSVFDRVVSEMLSEYPYADNGRAQDGSYMIIDTNPYDKDFEEMTYVEQQIFPRKEQDSLDGIKFVNKKLGFSDAVYRKMMETSALMGRQSEENNKYRVSWTYHPDTGLEVMYEKK